MTKKRRKLYKRIVHWVMVAYLLVYIVSGFGITSFQTVEPLTLGLMGKADALQLHNNMEIPFLAIIVVHVLLSLVIKGKDEKQGSQ